MEREAFEPQLAGAERQHPPGRVPAPGPVPDVGSSGCCRRIRLEQRTGKGDRGAPAALELLSNPTPFLSTVQIGITLVGIFWG